MSSISYVSQDSLKIAESLEKKFLNLAGASGIIFVGAVPIPAEDGIASSYIITLGITKEMSKGTAVALAKSLLTPEIEKGINLSIMPVHGISGPAAVVLNTH